MKMSSEQDEKVQDVVQPEDNVNKDEHEEKAELMTCPVEELSSENLITKEEENEKTDEAFVPSNQSEATQTDAETDISNVHESDEKITSLEKILTESINAYEDDDNKPGDYLILSIINLVLMLCMRSFGFFVAVPAFYYSLRTCEAVDKGDVDRALRSESNALNLNCLAILVTMAEFFVYPHLGLLFDLWVWEMVWFF